MNDDLELNYYTAALSRRWPLVIGVAAVVALAVLFLLPRQKTEFESTTTVLLDSFSVEEVEGINREEPVRVPTEIAIARSDSVLQSAIAEVGIDRTTRGVDDRLTIVAEEESEVFEIIFRGATTDEAEQMSAAIARWYLESKRVEAQTALDDRLAAIDREIEVAAARFDEAVRELDEAEPGSTLAAIASGRVARFDQQIDDLESRADLLRTVIPDVGNVLDLASEAEARRRGISTPLAVLASAVLGSTIGLGAAMVADRFDRGLRSPETVEEELDTEVIGEIPRITEGTPELVTAMRAQTAGADAFRRFGAGVLASGDDVRSVLITSANDREGRTTTAINLAIALQQAGRRVCLVSADRRNPEIDRVFGLSDRAGLDQYFRGPRTEADAQNLLAEASARLGMRVVASGVVPGSVPQPLSAEGVKAILAVAAEQNAMVIFDAPPATTSADGLGLAGLCDRTFVVVDKGRSRRAALQGLRAELRHVHARVGGALTIQTGRWLSKSGSIEATGEWTHELAGTAAATESDWTEAADDGRA